MKNKKIRNLIYSSMLLAVLIIFQYMTSFAGQIITGTLVNFTLICACLLIGTRYAVSISVISPFLAKLFGIGPAIVYIIPVISLANVIYVLCYGAFFKYLKVSVTFKWVSAVISGAAAKFAVLYFTCVKILIPVLNLPWQKAKAVTAIFGFPQFITAFLGGLISFVLIPIMKKEIKKI